MARLVKMPTLLSVVITLLAIFLGLFSTSGFSSYTKRIYNLGGALRLFQSQDQCFNCSDSTQTSWSNHKTINCHFAKLQGRREYQEDRLFCDLNLRIPFYVHENKVKEVSVGMAAVFDGHGGAEASEMASQLVLDYFLLHSRLIQSEIKELIEVPDESTRLGILKEALVRTIRDIDTTFTKEASEKGIVAGSTAAIAIVADNQILVANVGDSKVILCSQNNPQDIKAKVLTRDHHPDREDERRRIEAAGGYVVSLPFDVPRVIGRLAVSRAIGDLYYKRWGVIAEPEVSDWQALSKNDRYLVISSDGIFESLKAQQVCQLLPANPRNILATSDDDEELGLLESDSLPQHIIRTAYEKGSMDNLSVIVLPLKEAALV